jgi:hypothetical protein
MASVVQNDGSRLLTTVAAPTVRTIDYGTIDVPP